MPTSNLDLVKSKKIFDLKNTKVKWVLYLNTLEIKIQLEVFIHTGQCQVLVLKKFTKKYLSTRIWLKMPWSIMLENDYH